jgi:hypothetical protein
MRKQLHTLTYWILFAICASSIYLVGYEVARAWGIDRYPAWVVLGPLLAGASVSITIASL